MDTKEQKMSQRIETFEPNVLSFTPKFRDMNTRWVEKVSQNSARVASPPASDGYWNYEPKFLAERTGFCDGNFYERSKKWVGKPSKNSPSVASPFSLHENRNSGPDSLSSRSGSPDGCGAEKKKKKKMKKKRAGKLPQSSGSVVSPSVSSGNEVSKDSTEKLSFLDHTHNNLSVGAQSSDDCSKTSKQGSAESSSTSVVEDVVGQCSKQVELEDSKIRSNTSWTHNGKENRNFGWNRRQYNAREGHVSWGEKPGYRNGVTDANSAGNRCWVDLNPSANGSILRSPLISSGYGNGKENWHFGWNRRQYNPREGHVNWGKKPNYRNGVKDVNPADNHFWSERYSLANNAISPTWSNSSGHNNSSYGYRKRDVPPRLLNEAPQGAASPKKKNWRLFVAPKSQTEEGKKRESENLVGRSAGASKPVNCNGEKAACNYEANFSELHAKRVPYHEEFSPGCSDVNDYKRDTEATNGKQIASHGDRHCLNSPSMYSKMSAQGVMNDIQQHKFKKIPNMESEFGKSVHASVDGTPGCHTDHKLEKDTSRANILQRTAAGTKEFWPVDRIPSASISNESNISPDLSRELKNSHLGGTIISCRKPISYDDPNMERKSSDAKYRGPKDTDQFLIGSHMGMKALTAAYQMQLASETVQLAMGCPLAEFETFIHCAAPVIPSPYVHKEYSISLGTQPSHSLLGKHQIPNLSLHSVWNWYEIPGNYGLDVKAVCPKTLTGLPNDSMSLQAYFAPSLSAIQLFGPHIPGCKTLFSNSSAAPLDHIQVGSFDVALPDKSCAQSPDCSPVFSYDAELIFQFFEVELPHNRRPFYNKILELISTGTSNPLVFGDPSKLASLNLRDVHPASWFSVAWYPVYQIPEGHLGASFLTYHSLGHFVQRPGSTVAPGCICFPVLGLQSYNSQDESWFEHTIPSSKEPTSFDTTGILIKRLRTLDENAMHFARGWVYKDNVFVQNRHPDYEFFTSRKTRFK